MDFSRLVLGALALGTGALAGCSGTDDRAGGSSADALLLDQTQVDTTPFAGVKTGPLLGAYDYKTKQTWTAGTTTSYAINGLTAAARAVTLSVVARPIAATSCDITLKVYSTTGLLLAKTSHDCGTPSDPTAKSVDIALLGAVDPAYHPATLEVTAGAHGGVGHIGETIFNRDAHVNDAGLAAGLATTLASGDALSGNLYSKEQAHYYKIAVPAGQKLSLSGEAATRSMAGNLTIEFQSATGTRLSYCINKSYVDPITSGATAIACTTSTFTSSTDVYIYVDHATVTDSDTTQLEYDLTATTL